MSNEENLKIGICTHAFKDVDFSVYFNHLWCIGQWNKKYDLVLCGKKGLDAATARNQIVEKALEQGCTHLFWMDADHLFPAESLDLLLETKDEAMVSGLVCKRGEEYPQVGYQKTAEGAYMPVALPLDGRVYQVSVCAFGCTLISMKHLLKLEKPIFRDICRPTVKGELYNFRSDINLCEDLAKVGERCFIDTRVLIGHHGFDDVVYPQQAEMRTHLDRQKKLAVKLKRGVFSKVANGNIDEEGFYYEP